jgi:hypothetical protein
VGGRTTLRAAHRAGSRFPEERRWRRYEREERKKNGEGECCGGDDEEIWTNNLVLNERKS